MGKGFYACWQIIQKTRLGGKYGHQLTKLCCNFYPNLFCKQLKFPWWFWVCCHVYFQYLQIRNARGHVLQCSHYMPSPFPEETPLPCVVYCHGNRFIVVTGSILCSFNYVYRVYNYDLMPLLDVNISNDLCNPFFNQLFVTVHFGWKLIQFPVENDAVDVGQTPMRLL